MGALAPLEPKPTAEPTAASQVKAPGRALVTPMNRTFDIGERIVGSEQVADLLSPIATAGSRVTMVSTIESDGSAPAFWLVGAPFQLRTAGDAAPPQPIRVMFKPTQRGVFKAKLKCLFTFPDYSTATQTVELIGRARDMQDASSAMTAAKRPHDDLAQQIESIAPESKINNAATCHVGPALQIGLLDNAIEGIATDQRAAIAFLQPEALSYKAPPPPPSFFAFAAQMALTLAGGSIAKFAAGRAAGMFMPSGSSTAGMQDAENMFADGIAYIGAEAVKPLFGSTESFTPNSTTGYVQWFQNQSDAVSSAMADRKAKMREMAARVESANQDNPQHATDVIGKVVVAAAETKVAARSAQTLATSVQWTRLVNASKRDTKTVTDIEGREDIVSNPIFFQDRGTLVLTATVDNPRRPTATLAGIAQGVANQLADQPLAKQPIFLRYEIYAHLGSPIYAVIQRDEAGRIQLEGLLDLIPGVEPGARPADAVAAAEAFLESVLSNRLGAIQSNDASKK